MGRTHARLLTAIWTDDDFRQLDAGTQRAYLLLMSQPELSICGVLDYNPKRLARLATDTTPAKIIRAVGTLEQRRYIVVDPDTDELVLRTFLRHDGVLDMPNSLKAAARAWAAIHSPIIRRVIADALPAGVAAVWPEPLSKMPADRIKELLAEPHTKPLPEPIPNGIPEPMPEGMAEPPGSNSLTLTLSRSSSRTLPPEHADTNSSPDQPPSIEEDLRATTALIARRKLDARRDRGEEDPNDVDAWLATVERNDTDRLRSRHRLLVGQHPHWTIEQLADELDPDTAPRIGNYMNAEESQAWLDEQERHAESAVPMPDTVKDALHR